MNTYKIMYIEKKEPSGNGEARIGKITFSKTGRTIYYKDKVLQSLKGKGISANYYDINTNDSYWVSGVKKSGSNRHPASKGSSKVIVDHEATEEFLLITNGVIPKGYEIES